jgi:hypothetical protein
MRAILVFLMVFCLSSLLNAAPVYRWVDDQGVTHFTDDPTTVPEMYREKAEILEMPVKETARPSEKAIVLEEEDEGILVEDDLKEKDEDWWRKRAEKWRDRLQTAYEDYERIRLRYNATATEFNTSKRPEARERLKTELDQMQTEMEKQKAEIERARKINEEVLPSQAKKAGIPLEWVR